MLHVHAVWSTPICVPWNLVMTANISVQLANFSLGDWKDTPLLMLLSSSNRKYPHFPLLSYFSVVVCLRCLLYSVTYCVYIPRKPGICFRHYCAVYDEYKWSGTFWLEDRIRLFVHNVISLSSLCKLIWRHWTYKCLSDIFCRVCE